ncbi:hypothetical protein CC80DRAFT_549853 [Byssothecium circinans]|uniref:NAD dependent epimerase/dehydratase n=1 Tax=Byssothecium circinans TaxID=147558 RepID=A0A6A5TQE4_9PLEO|nr:hypothetical protein CC80DRAFT_549853 [Byssothecium circinans]
MTTLRSPLWCALEVVYGYFAPNPPPHVRDADKPMQVICVGLPRSGTESLQKALLLLGYDYTYHGWDMLNETPHRMNSWVALARRKYFDRSGKPLTAADFDALLGNSVAVTDAAANCFAPELIAAYPDAKVILNTRKSVDAWHSSVMTNIVGVNEDWFKWLLCWFNADLWWMWHVQQRVLWPSLFRCPKYWSLRSGVEPLGKDIHEEHSAMIRTLVPKERLLEWNVDDGWDDLCKFLEKDVPSRRFPRANDKMGFKKRVETDLDALGRKAMLNMLIASATAAVVVYLTWTTA